MCQHVQETELRMGRIMEPAQCEFCNRKYTMEIIHNRCVVPGPCRDEQWYQQQTLVLLCARR